MIIPAPTALTTRPGHFVIEPFVCVSADPGAEPAAELLLEYLDRPLTEIGDVIRLEISPEHDDLGPEGYFLEVRTDHVTLRAPALAGLLHGVQTLRQLLPASALAGDASDWRWPCVTVTDQPRLPWRGMMLDVARHYMPIEFLHGFVDQLALHKLNVLHLHLTDDQGWRIEIDGMPRLVEVGAWRTESMVGPAGGDTFDGTPHGGYYTAAELRELVAYAARRGVTVVPEIDMPGHVRALLAAYPALGNTPEAVLPVWTSWGISSDILSVTDETLEACRTILGETLRIFPSTYVHIGGDECPTVQWETSAAARDRARAVGLEPRELRDWFLQQMHSFLASEGRRATCWAEAGSPSEALPRSMTLAAWLQASDGVQAVERGHQVIMGAHGSTYLDYRQSSDDTVGNLSQVATLADFYRYDPLAGGLPTAQPANGDRPGVLGAQAQLWTEFAPTPDHVRYLVYPRLCAFAEVAWSTGQREYHEFTTRLAVHSRRLAALGALAARPSGPATQRHPAPAGTMEP